MGGPIFTSLFIDSGLTSQQCYGTHMATGITPYYRDTQSIYDGKIVTWPIAGVCAYLYYRWVLPTAGSWASVCVAIVDSW